MKGERIRFAARQIALGTALLLGAVQSPALTIVRNFDGGAAVGSNTGSGSIQGIFNAAADCWEDAILDSHTVTIGYSWAALGGGTLGVHSLVAQGGSPNRETAATIRFDQSTPWFLDSTPLAAEEYGTYTETFADLGGGSMKVGRVFSGPNGDASGHWDLFSVALHEIGHSLGMSGANTSFQGENSDGDIDITGPRPFAGSSLPTVSGAHLNLANSLMYPSIGSGLRRFYSHADILANAQISQFTDLNLDAHPVPEPVSLCVTLVGVVGLVRSRRRRA